MKSNESCWCGHQVRWHSQSKTTRSHTGEWLYTCKWCIKKKLTGMVIRGVVYKHGRYPSLFTEQDHELATEVPFWMHREAAAKLDALLAPKI